MKPETFDFTQSPDICRPEAFKIAYDILSSSGIDAQVLQTRQELGKARSLIALCPSVAADIQIEVATILEHAGKIGKNLNISDFHPDKLIEAMIKSRNIVIAGIGRLVEEKLTELGILLDASSREKIIQELIKDSSDTEKQKTLLMWSRITDLLPYTINWTVSVTSENKVDFIEKKWRIVVVGENIFSIRNMGKLKGWILLWFLAQLWIQEEIEGVRGYIWDQERVYIRRIIRIIKSHNLLSSRLGWDATPKSLTRLIVKT